MHITFWLPGDYTCEVRSAIARALGRPATKEEVERFLSSFAQQVVRSELDQLIAVDSVSQTVVACSH